MTRADVINGLGIGHLSHRALQASKRLGQTESSSDKEDEEEDATSDDEQEEDDSSIERSESSDQAGEWTDGQEEEDVGAVGTGIPCRASDIGGFYSALCSLGTGISVGTKVSCVILLCTAAPVGWTLICFRFFLVQI